MCLDTGDNAWLGAGVLRGPLGSDLFYRRYFLFHIWQVSVIFSNYKLLENKSLYALEQ